MSLNLHKKETRQALVNGAQRAAQKLSLQFSLPLSGKTWSGHNGNHAGSGIGNSIDFQDHRAYVPGDDPRHIDWQAYARTGQYIMKQYREEVSPTVDIIFDVTASMFLTPAKAKLSMLLFYFCWFSARENGATPIAWQLCGDKTRQLSNDEVLSGSFEMASAKVESSGLEFLELRRNSLRIWISDLLFSGEPTHFLLQILRANGLLLVYAPADAAEGQPAWQGNLDMLDVESSTVYRRFVDEKTLQRYLKAYQRHFALWQEQIRKNGAMFGHFSAAISLEEQLRREGLAKQLVEPAL